LVGHAFIAGGDDDGGGDNGRGKAEFRGQISSLDGGGEGEESNCLELGSKKAELFALLIGRAFARGEKGTSRAQEDDESCGGESQESLFP